MLELSDIPEAARLAGKIHRTPLLSAAALGEAGGVRVFLKCENFQKQGSFKARGALNKILSLTAAEKAQGIVAGVGGESSAGRRVGRAKRRGALRGRDARRRAALEGRSGPRVRGRDHLHPDRQTLFDKLEEVRKARGLTFVHPFDDPVVLAGAGTAGLEIVEDLPDVDCVYVPVGGGGLMGGVATAVKSVRPEARVVAVELAAGPGLARR